MEPGKEQGEIGRAGLLDDLKLVLAGVEQLLRPDAAQAGAGQDAALDSMLELEQLVLATARDALEAGDQYVRAHPWQAIGAGAVAGLALGLLLGRR